MSETAETKEDGAAKSASSQQLKTSGKVGDEKASKMSSKKTSGSKAASSRGQLEGKSSRPGSEKRIGTDGKEEGEGGQGEDDVCTSDSGESAVPEKLVFELNKNTIELVRLMGKRRPFCFDPKRKQVLSDRDELKNRFSILTIESNEPNCPGFRQDYYGPDNPDPLAQKYKIKRGPVNAVPSKGGCDLVKELSDRQKRCRAKRQSAQGKDQASTWNRAAEKSKASRDGQRNSQLSAGTRQSAVGHFSKRTKQTVSEEGKRPPTAGQSSAGEVGSTKPTETTEDVQENANRSACPYVLECHCDAGADAGAAWQIHPGDCVPFPYPEEILLPPPLLPTRRAYENSCYSPALSVYPETVRYDAGGCFYNAGQRTPRYDGGLGRRVPIDDGWRRPVDFDGNFQPVRGSACPRPRPRDFLEMRSYDAMQPPLVVERPRLPFVVGDEQLSQTSAPSNAACQYQYQYQYQYGRDGPTGRRSSQTNANNGCVPPSLGRMISEKFDWKVEPGDRYDPRRCSSIASREPFAGVRDSLSNVIGRSASNNFADARERTRENRVTVAPDRPESTGSNSGKAISEILDQINGAIDSAYRLYREVSANSPAAGDDYVPPFSQPAQAPKIRNCIFRLPEKLTQAIETQSIWRRVEKINKCPSRGHLASAVECRRSFGEMRCVLR